jgi:hypothetical protein
MTESGKALSSPIAKLIESDISGLEVGGES